MPRPRKTYSHIGNGHAIKQEVSSGNKNEFIPTNRLNGTQEDLLKSIVFIDGVQDEAASNTASDLAFYAEAFDREAIPYLYNSPYTDQTGRAAGSMSQLLIATLPRSRRGRIIKANEYYHADDLLCDLIDVKLSFTTTGISLQAKPPLNLESDKNAQEEVSQFQSILNDISFGIDIEKIADDLLRDWYLSDSMILYWRTEVQNPGSLDSDSSIPNDDGYKYGIPGIYDISALNPGVIDWNNSLGQDILYIDISDDLRKQVKDAVSKGKYLQLKLEDIIQGLIKLGIGRKWIEAIIADKKQVELRKEDGDNWIIRTKSRKHHGLAWPSMFSIFLPLETRRLLNEGEFSAAFIMKHFIMLIKQGESIDSGPQTGSTKNWLKPKDSKALMKQFSTVNKAMKVTANHTTKIEFIFPPPEMFDEKKFNSCERRIFNWAGVAQAIISGKDNTYSAGFITIKRMISQIEKARRELTSLLMRFFFDITVRDKIKTPKEFLVTTTYDSNVLKEPRQLLDEVRFLFESAIGNPRSSAKELGRDPEQLKAGTIQSRKENENLEVWEPVGTGQQSYGGRGIQGQGGGRPANSDTTLNDETRNQSPYGNTTENT